MNSFESLLTICLWLCLFYISFEPAYSNFVPKHARTPLLFKKLIRFRGGAGITSPTKTVIVSTSIGSSFLDKKKKFIVNNETTIKDLKHLISQKFSGSPPVELQSLFHAGAKLDDDQYCYNVTNLPTATFLLDMITGTAGYNKTLSITQAIEAYVATVVQMTYIGNKMKELITPPLDLTSNVDNSIQSVYYRQLFEAVNASVYEKYHDQIIQALEEEKDPEYYITDKYVWRQEDRQPIGHLGAAIAKEFDLNWQGLQNFVYYSAILGIFAVMGTQTSTAFHILLSFIPMLWISKLRQLRLLYKIALYTFLPLAVKLDFLLPLLPAPLQVISLKHKEWFPDASAYKEKVEDELHQEDRSEEEEEEEEEDPSNEEEDEEDTTEQDEDDE